MFVAHALTLTQIVLAAFVAHRSWVLFLYGPIFFVNAITVGVLGGTFFPPIVEACQPDPGYGGPLGLNSP